MYIHYEKSCLEVLIIMLTEREKMIFFDRSGKLSRSKFEVEGFFKFYIIFLKPKSSKTSVSGRNPKRIYSHRTI